MPLLTKGSCTETSKAKHLAINLETEQPRAIGKGMSCSQGVREGCMRGVTSSLGLEGEVEFHAADKGPHLGCCWQGRRKASPSRRERHRLNTAWRSLATVAKAHSEAPLGAP